ncbi:MAG: DoxX family protein [Ilumatobacteraceae bacterium]|nr:DoxX family protein [Ilumatobacteraceae bacterium]
MTIAVTPTRAQGATFERDRVEARAEPARIVAARYVGALVRVSLGFTFLWAFLDKTFGWGKATPAAGAWLDGGSPTTGFLSGAAGPFASTFHSMAGSAWADWLFMAGLLGVGVALTLGIGMRIAAASGGLLLVFMWAASLPLDNNPFMDDHLIYAMVLVGLALVNAGDTAGLGRVWSRLPLVGRLPFLR